MTRHPIPPFTVVLALCLWAPFDISHANKPGEPLSDNAVRYAVEVKLAKDPGVFSQDLDTRVEEGIVTLEGHVQNLVMKERAVRLAKTRRGVRGVVDRLEFRPLVRSDEQIADGVRHAIENAPLQEAYENVTVSVEDGAVFLDGTVPSGTHRNLVGSIAAGIIGVRDIENRISLDQDSLDDEEIRATIEARLHNDLWLANSDLQVEVEDGFVTLKGAVVSDGLRQRAARLSWVRGTEKVFANQLEANPSESQAPEAPSLRSDQEIAEAIEAAWELDPRIGSHSNLKVHVVDGEATLMGQAFRLSGLAAAADDARNVFGVTRVVNLAKVRPASPGENDAILSAFKDALEIEVQNGRVEILGLVENDFHKRRASKLVARVAGVKDIHNRLRTEVALSLSGPANSPRPTDDQRTHRSDTALEEAVEFELFWDWEVSPGEISVTVDDGVAILTGEAANSQARDAATEAALDAGAPSVINDIVIRRDDTEASSGDSTSQ